MWGRLSRAAGVALALAWAFLPPLPARAGAAVRYAEPGGNGPAATCPQSDPCDIQVAVEDPSVADGDTVVVLPGDYVLTSDLVIDDVITVRSEPGMGRPRLARAGNVLYIPVAATVRGLYVESTSGSDTVVAFGPTLEQMVIVATGGANYGATLHDSAVLRDSVAWTDVSAAVRTSGTGATLINATLIGAGGSSDGIEVNSDNGQVHTVLLHNTIARGTDAGVQGINGGGGGEPDNVDVFVNNSNYSSVVDPAGTEVEIILGPGNQTAQPLFADAANVDFHQVPGSPTIDAGAAHAIQGAGDLDGEPRAQGSAPDIGADEIDGTPPDTEITRHPRKRTVRHRAKFRFESTEPGSTFQCKLKGGFRPCTPPKRYGGLDEGRYTFRVRAMDALGNTDPTPDRFRWRIVEG